MKRGSFQAVLRLSAVVVMLMTGLGLTRATMFVAPHLPTGAPQTNSALGASANYQLVSNAVASGNSGAPMQSSNYRLQAVLGEVGLPATTTTLSSTNFLHQPGFLAGEPTPHLLAIYALAFDNIITSTANLTPYFPEIYQNLLDATKGRSDLTVVVLADRDQSDDTLILTLHNGRSTPWSGLPDSTGVLRTTLREYDMADGVTLGGFLQWARRQYAATKTTFSFIGHGAPLMPETPFVDVFPDLARRDQARPTRTLVHPDVTEQHPAPRFLSVYQLAMALRLGSAGLGSFDVVDLQQCFATSIEELYELAPYAKMLTGSPNYAYLSAAMLKAGLQALTPSMSPAALATSLITSYNTTLRDDEHPRLLVAVDGTKVPAIKTAWDATAAQLLFEWKANPTATRQKLLNAYLASAKYDTTFCAPQDWNLAPPDALTDFSEFAQQLSAQFGPTSGVGNTALTAKATIGQAIVHTQRMAGVPWYADRQTAVRWTMPGAGISLYTDLQPTLKNGVSSFAWQSQWYTTTTGLQNTLAITNPHPYGFIQRSGTTPTWADVLNTYWAATPMQTAVCMPIFPPAQGEAELSVDRVLIPNPGTLTVGSTTPLVAAVTTDRLVQSPLVRFSIQQLGQEVFANTVSAGYFITGTHALQASEDWIPTQTGEFSLTVTVNPDGRIISDTLDNNSLIVTNLVGPQLPTDRPILQAQVLNQQQWLTQTTVPLSVTQRVQMVASPPIQTLIIETYQYIPSIDPRFQIPVLLSTTQLDQFQMPNVTFKLPPTIQPGVVVLLIKGISAGGQTRQPAEVKFNYIPPNMLLAANRSVYFLARLRVYDQLSVNLQVNQNEDANLFMWYPKNYTRPDLDATNPGGDQIVDSTVFEGEHVISVQGVSAPQSHVTLQITRNGVVGARPAAQTLLSPSAASVPQARPIFPDVLPFLPNHFLFTPLLRR